MTLRAVATLSWIGFICAAQTQTLPKRYQLTDSAPQASDKKTYQVDVSGAQQWTDSGVDVTGGTRLQITATGSLQYAQSQAATPDGLTRGWKDLLRVLPMNDAGRGALVGRIGTGESASAFLIGTNREVRANRAGRLYLGVNQLANEPAEGTYHVSIQVLEAGSATAPLISATAIDPTKAADVQGIDAALFAKIPRRNSDPDGNLGDMVNFLIVGSEVQMRRAFDTAGWVVVDRTKRDAVLHGLMATLSKQSYVQVPMSELFLFGRAQDYGFAHAEPFAVVASRHHLRLWKAPFEVNGQTLWVGAATHDIGFEKDQRNNGVTHKIDPAIDGERTYVAQSLSDTGVVAKAGYFTPPSALTEARTATGGSFHSDGKVLVLALGTSGSDASSAFANLFCSVMTQEHPDVGDWGPCSQYIDAPSMQKVDLGALSAKYRLLIVPGVFSSCVESTAPAYKEGQVHLREKHGMTVEMLSMPNATSESNAQLISKYLQDHLKDDARKYIVLGYSKGAPDLEVALASDPAAAASVAAFITVAGAVGGSPIADVLPAQADKWLQMVKGVQCEGDLTGAFKSLQRNVRQAFLSAHPTPPVPTYSLAAVSDKTNTSKFMLENWLMMSVYDPKQDSQLVKGDTIVPGATYLGAAKADHFAVALPFESASDSTIRTALDKNHFPRTALLEALVRFVTQDLEKK